MKKVGFIGIGIMGKSMVSKDTITVVLSLRWRFTQEQRKKQRM